MTKTRRTTPVSFPMGQIVSTSNALHTLPQDQVLNALQRHARGDWGDLDEHDWQANELALVDGSRLFSAYHTKDDTKFWIITDAQDDRKHRAATTILLPEDY